MSNVLAWIKSNVYIVVFSVVIVATLVSMPIVSAKLNAGVRAEAETRAKKFSEMESLEKTTVEPWPGAESKSVLVNQKLLDAYRVAVENRKEDADSVYERAIEHNRKQRGVLMPELFPEPAARRAEVLPEKFFRRLQDEYDDIVLAIGAGAPPSPDSVAELLRRREQQFLTNILAMDAVEDLDDEQRDRLTEHLRDVRIRQYVQAAQEISLYASKDVMDLPEWIQSDLPSLAEMFSWQWSLWIYQDFLEALRAANRDAPSVVQAPVKQLLVAQVVRVALEPSGSTGGGGFAGGRGDPAPQGMPLNPSIEARLDFATSITGRSTNPLYDVRYMTASLIIDPTRLPEILDALARQNFITVVNMRLTDTNPYAALKEGFFYGPGSVAQLDVTLESIWLRSWTKQFMPPSVRAHLNIAPDASAQPADGTG